MRPVDIAYQRFCNQHIAEPTFQHPRDVVEWLGAVQAQDYAAALWAIGLRLQDVTSDDLEQAFADGTILRTHVMRPTWHFVSPVDIRWLLALTAPRVNKDSIILTPSCFLPLDQAQTHAFALSTNRYGAFLDRSATLTFQVQEPAR